MLSTMLCCDRAHGRVARVTLDGKESVSFLMAVKQMIGDPAKLVFGNKEPAEVLLGI